MLNAVPHATDLTEAHLTASVEELAASSVHPFQVFEDLPTLYSWLAREMADELKARNEAGEETRWILPVGPKAHYPELARICNEERISWKNVTAFHMDEYLDWQGRMLSPDNPFSFRGYCARHLYGLLDTDLLPSDDRVVYPDVHDPDAFDTRIEDAGGAHTCFAGFGYRGHLAFNEPPSTRWHHYSVDEFAASKTRIIPLLEDTIVAHSNRMTGGYTQAIPRMAISIGMKSILSSQHLRLITDGGAWKQYIVRVMALTTQPDVMYPCTLAHTHPNVDITVNRDSALPCSLEL
ncbi:hypothetical protein [Propionimicrobium sp. PCR01-08-3]|uniref:hypothetical protein n=1 Tax=Propionimicrobium sp. PCR01-08-3 TaxID=3052086 RepID=UPI00255D0F60|nr:hypothetical protein [Propionimicrobium sp. PCR01-08-3]WIY83492.1 hypothetical protein QQ658_03810 [Propionimicrobium sp. PCR01-08-3]